MIRYFVGKEDEPTLNQLHERSTYSDAADRLMDKVPVIYKRRGGYDLRIEEIYLAD